MYELRAFDDDWNIIKDLEDGTMEIAIQVAEFKKHSTKPKSPYARQLVRIMDKPIHTSFIEAMLFCGTSIDTISSKSELSGQLILYYKELFFDTEEFMCKLDKIEYFQWLLDSSQQGEGMHTKGILLKSAFTYGWEYIASQFHMDEIKDFGKATMEVIARNCYYKYTDDVFAGLNSEKMFRDGKVVQGIIKSYVDSSGESESEKKEDLLNTVMEINREYQDTPKFINMVVFDTEREAYVEDISTIDVKVIEDKSKD